MKPSRVRVPSRRAILTASIGALLGLAGSSSAQTVYWDPLADGNGQLGGAGVWNLTNLFWDVTGTDPVVADNMAWPNTATAIAVFSGTPGAVTINTGAGVTANALVFDVSGYTVGSNVAADVLTMAGANPTITVSNANQFARINSIIAGTAGLNYSGAGTVFVGGANTYSGQTQIVAGTTVSLNAAAGLGATGVGNETIVNAGGTLNIGGQAVSGNPAPAAVTEIIQIAGSGVGGVGALINSGAAQQNALAKVVLTADATIGAGTGIATSYNAAGQVVTAAGGRLDIRVSGAPTAGQNHLDLAGFTLTKTGSNLLALVNVEVSSGNIVVNEGQLNLEAGTLVQGSGTITVNQNGKLGFWSSSAAGNITRQIIVNGGTIGDPTSTGAAQTINAPITIATANPNFVAVDNTNPQRVTTLAGLINQGAGSITEVAKRGIGSLAFTNVGNSFTAPVKIYAGTLRGDFSSTLSGGVPPASPLTSTDTPFGTNPTIILAGGTVGIRANMDNNNSQQVFDLQRAIVVDMAPGGMTFDRIGNTTQTDKHVRINSLTMAPASAANGYSIGQNQFTFTQGNTHRIEIPLMTMNSDSVLATGDHSLTGNILSANGNSLGHAGGNTIQFLAPGTHEFNAFFHLGGTLRIGSGFGTPTTNNTVTVGDGTIYVGTGTTATFRTPTNIAAGQVIDATVAQRLSIPVVNFEQFSAIPAALRARGSGVYGIGSATYADLDLSNVGDGTWRIGSNLGGSGNGTINGIITPGAGNVVRVGGGGAATATVTATATNAISGSASLEVGSALLNNAQTTSGTGTFLLTSANDYSGGTIINRTSTLRFQSSSLGTGPITIAGTATAESAGNAGPHGSFIGAGPATFLGGSTVRFVNDAITVDTTPTPDRWADTAPMNLVATTIEMRARSIPTIASDTIEVVGPMTVSGGSALNLQRLNTVTGHNVQLTAESLTRVNNGTLELNRSTGNGAGYSSGQKFIVTNSPPAVVNDMVAPWIVALDNGPANFMSYGPNGFVAVTYDTTVTTGTYVAGALNFNDGTQTGGKVAVTTTDLTLTDDPILYALRSERTINSSGANDSITLRSGGLNLRNATDNTTLTVNPALIANNGTVNTELLIHTIGGGTGRNYQLNGAITAAGLTKHGSGNLIIGTASPGLTGNVSVNGGTLELRAATAATLALAGNGSIRLQGGQLNVRGAAGNYTLTNGVTVAQNIVTATLDSNRTDAASTGTATFNPAAAGPGLVLEGAPGTQGQTLNVSGAQYGVAFGANAQNSFTGNVTINNAINLTLGQNPAILGANPVITKSGAGNLIVGINGGTPSVAPNTQVVLNGGTLEMRSIFAFGNGATVNTSFVLNSGTLNLRRDTAGDYGGTSTTAYPLTVNGSVTLSTDRAGGSATSFREGIGTITINGSPTLTVNNGNGIYPEVFGTVGGVSMRINGAAIIASNVAAGSVDSALRLTNTVVGGGLVKLGTGHIHLMAANTYDGGTYVNQGVVRARATDALGTGTVYLNPGAIIDFNSATNLGASQQMIVRSNSAFLPMISVNVNGIAHPTANVDTTNASSGVVGISNGTAGSYDNVVDLSSLYGGGWSFGGVATGAYDPVYTGPAIIAGNNSLYRLGGGGTAFAMGTDSARAARTNVLTGANNVRLGFDSSNILPVNQTNFQYSIAGVNDYSGGSTVIHRGMVARLFSNNDGTRSGLSNSAVNVYGVLSLSGQASLDNGPGHVNAVTLHPGSGLFFDNTNAAANGAGAFAAANVANRWNDTVPIALNSAMINLVGLLEGTSTETVGDVTFSGGSRIRSGRTNAQTPSGNATSVLTLNSLTRSGPGSTLLLQTAAANSLNAATNYDRIMVNNPPTPVNGMVAPYIVNATDNTFVTYGVNGFANVSYDTTVGAGTFPAGLAPTAKVDINFTGGVALTDNPVVYALRTNRDINLGGPFNTVTIRSGGLIGHANALTINSHLVFNDGAANVEALIHTGNTVNINGTITANGIVKSGNANLSINVPQTGYTSGWTVNSGTLQINDLEGLGQSVPTNTVTLNASLSTGGQASQAFGITNLTFNRNQGTPELQTFTGGPITVFNEGTIRVAGGDDRNLQIPAVTLDSTGTDSSVAFTYDVPNNRFRANIPNLTLNDDAIIRVLDSGATTDTGRITTGAVGQLTGNGKDLVKIGNRTLELTNDNSASFIGGSITVSQGTLRVRNNGSLGSATTATQIERNATLEIDTTNFTPAGPVVQLPGSIERWNREDARGTTHNLPAGVNLQLNTNLNSARTIGLNGGSLEAFLWTDHPLAAVERTVGSAVTINLLANSSVGQNVIQGQGYDAGRQPITGQPFGDTLSGAYLRIDGNITGNFDLTKTGFDTVTIGGAANTYRNTIVDLGSLRLGRANALPTTGVLTTRLNGTLDLYGNNQVVAGLGTANAGPNPGGTGVGSSGRITNSATTSNTLLVNSVADFTYNGVIEQNVALTKAGGGSLTLGGANTYSGDTDIIDGTLVVTGSITGSALINVGAGATLNVAAAAGGFVLGADQTLAGEGTVVGNATFDGLVSPGSSPGVLTLNGTATFNTGSAFALEINSAVAFDKLIATSTSLNGAVNLTLSLGYTPLQNTQFMVLENTGIAPIGGSSGLFTWGGPEGLLTEGEEFVVGASTFSITYAGGAGSNDVVLTAVPEPVSGVMLLGGLALLTARRRRQS